MRDDEVCPLIRFLPIEFNFSYDPDSTDADSLNLTEDLPYVQHHHELQKSGREESGDSPIEFPEISYMILRSVLGLRRQKPGEIAGCTGVIRLQKEEKKMTKGNSDIPFGALLTAIATPFTADLEVDYKRAEELAQKLIHEGSDGLVVGGSTGEWPTLSHEEKLKLFKTVKEAVGKNYPVLAGTGMASTKETIAFTKEVERLGVDGALVVCPYYNKPPQEGLFQHFKAVAHSTTLPIVLYNIPGRTCVNMLPETTVRLSQFSNIVGIKESSGSIEQISEIAKKARAGFTIWSGDDALTLPLLSVGAKGVICVTSHLVGPEIKKMIESFFNGNAKEAEAIHERLLPLFKVLFVTSSPIMLKAALTLKGFPIGGVRLPLIDASEKEILILQEAMSALNVLA